MKTPEQILSEARKEAHESCGCCAGIKGNKQEDYGDEECVETHVLIDRLVRIARIVGRVEQHEGECIHPTPCALRDRLLAELKEVPR